jgi:hypothetical protein
MVDRKADDIFGGDGDPLDDPCWHEAEADSKTESDRQVRRRRKRAKFSYKRWPDVWVGKLRKGRHAAAWTVASRLLELDWQQYGRPFEEGEPITLGNTWLSENGVSPRSKWRALDELQSWGLVHVKHRPRKSPLITLVPPSTLEPP